VKAVLCQRFGPPDELVVADIPDPVASAGEVVAKVAAVGLNFFDTLIIAGKYQTKPPFPFSPGGEFAGVVESVGPGVDEFAPGDRVMGYTNFNAARERTAVAASQIVKVPAGLDLERAAALTITYGTAYYGLKYRAMLRPQETLAVLGASGGVGLAAVELGREMGARVIACASSDDKLAVCRSHGADATINYATEDLRERIKALTEGRGVDVIYDPVGGPYSEPAFRSIAWRGRHLVVGFAAGDIPKLPLNLALLKGASVVGVFWGDFTRREPARFADSVKQLTKWYAAGRLKPHVSQTFPLEKAAEALKLMAARQVKGKVVLTVG
jgi:NADPH:quinone reductase